MKSEIWIKDDQFFRWSEICIFTTIKTQTIIE